LLSLLSGRDCLRACGVELSARITAAGGGARSRATRQLLADLSGEEVVTLDAEEATARGACIQAAAIAAGADTGGLVDLAKRWQPAVRDAAVPRNTGRDVAALRARWAAVAESSLIDGGPGS
jgi:xylulokinase